MKRLLVTLTIALISFSSFATDEITVAPKVLESFKSSFKNASEINWTVSDNFYKASFNMNGQFVTAYFDAEGIMMGMTRNISSVQLPIALQASLKKNYDEYWISDLFEIANDEGTSYYITLENADTKLVLKSSSNSDWSSFKKLRKS
jgi:hypothetical protein